MRAGLRNPENSIAAPPYTQGHYEFDRHFVLGKQGLPYERFTLVENFSQIPAVNGDMEPASADDGNDGATKAEIATMMAANLHFELLGSGATSDDATIPATIGGVLLTTDSSSAQQVVIAPHLDANHTAWTGVLWGTENQVIWEAVIRTGASIASITIWAGLKLTFDQDITADNDQVFFRFDAGVANWETVTTIGGVADTQIDTGVLVVADTNYYFRIEIDVDRVAHFFINNKSVGATAALTDNIDLKPYIGVEGNAKTLIVVSTAISRIIFE